MPLGDCSSVTGEGAGWVGRAVQPPGKQAEFKGQRNENCALKNFILFSTDLKFYVF